MSIYFDSLKYRSGAEEPEESEEEDEDEEEEIGDEEDEDEDDDDDDEPTGSDPQPGEVDPQDPMLITNAPTQAENVSDIKEFKPDDPPNEKMTRRFKSLSTELLKFATESTEITTNDQILDNMKSERPDFTGLSDSEWDNFKIGLQKYIHKNKSFIGSYKAISQKPTLDETQFCCSPKGMDKFKRNGSLIKKIQLKPTGTYPAKPSSVETNPDRCSRTRHFFGDNLPCEENA